MVLRAPLRLSAVRARYHNASACKSAPKRDPARICNKALMKQRYFLGTGVPIGADLNPIKL
jgi:hypothetical protein